MNPYTLISTLKMDTDPATQNELDRRLLEIT